MKTYCFKLYKSKKNKNLHRQIDAAGLIYNHCIALHRRYYRLYHKSLNLYALQKHLTKLKRHPRFSYMKEIGSQAVQDVTERIDRAYRLFFRNLKHKVRTAPPSFKKIKKYKSYTLKQSGWKLLEGNAIRIGTRKQKGSNHQKKARLTLTRMYKKTANQRKDFHYKLANAICEEYTLVCIEDLNLKGMQKRWGRKVSDYGFAAFVSILEYQASKMGTTVQKVDRYYASSQTCHICGARNPETKDLHVREWTCPHCGAVHDRDRNAAMNILKVGASTFFGEVS